jgi:putative tricarboxylic transport membrane protein
MWVPIMNRRDLLAGLFWLSISVFILIEAIKSDIGTFRSPGPGFLPFWSGLILGTLAITLLVISILKKKRKMKIMDLWKNLEWGKLICVSLSLFLYLILLPIMGYLITTFGLMVFLLFIIERKKLWVQGVSACTISLVSYIIFYILLDIRLPKGIFGF